MLCAVCCRQGKNQQSSCIFLQGRKEGHSGDALAEKKGAIDYAEFALCQFAKDEEGGAFGIVKKVCDENNWHIHTLNNHSKVHLYDTTAGKFVLETSSNLNENPKIEQFSFEKDAELYDFYLQNMFQRW